MNSHDLFQILCHEVRFFRGAIVSFHIFHCNKISKEKKVVKVGSHLCMKENVGVHTIQLLLDELQRSTTILVLRIYAYFTAARASSARL